eukprot:TRINITY_DN26736_c0_g1_i1.p2 TRINITY_DN26736_c0_g1~~TRINITY_DN26736_c0_g1_i1.p2  ORF type:complete len:323 (-),score=6.73 TRINITY_DN26736_c0_g1_i1:61-1029(-)
MTGDSASVLARLEEDVSVHSPSRRPPTVPNFHIGNSSRNVYSVSHERDGVVGLAAAVARGHHPRRVEHEGRGGRIERHSHGLLLHGLHQRGLVVLGQHGVVGDARHALAREAAVETLGVGLARVGVGGRRHQRVLLQVVEALRHQSALAAGVAKGLAAIDHLLLGQLGQALAADGQRRLDGGRRREAVAGAAVALVLDGGQDGRLDGGPVDGREGARGPQTETAGGVAGLAVERAVGELELVLLGKLGGLEVGELVDGQLVGLGGVGVVLEDGVEVVHEDLVAAHNIAGLIVLVIRSDEVGKEELSLALRQSRRSGNSASSG